MLTQSTHELDDALAHYLLLPLPKGDIMGYGPMKFSLLSIECDVIAGGYQVKRGG
jgi:hypothetical protein